MPNADAPRGFRPIRHLSGGEIRANKYEIVSTQAGDIFQGSLVQGTGTGKGIAIAGVADAVIGVFEGVKYTLPSGEIVYEKYWPGGTTLQAGTVAEAIVYDDPNIVFAAQHDGTPVADDTGTFYAPTAEAGNALLGRSTQEIDSSTTGTGTVLKTLGLVSAPDNELDEFAEMEVLLVLHEARIAV